jgi:chromosome segregation ATPase
VREENERLQRQIGQLEQRSAAEREKKKELRAECHRAATEKAELQSRLRRIQKELEKVRAAQTAAEEALEQHGREKESFIQQLGALTKQLAELQPTIGAFLR